MKHAQTYVKVASYEARGKVRHVVLLYSGGLDTSCMIVWIREHYGATVTALTIDLGQQGDDLENIRLKALHLGAKRAVVVDAKEEFANDYLACGIKANARYQGDYHLSTPLGRPLLAKWAVAVAHDEGADAIVHGCTGKGNDQLRIEAAALSLDPTIKVVAPVREWDMDREEEIAYAKERGIPVPANFDFPYSVDDNMWGMTWEGGEIEDPRCVPNFRRFLRTYTLPEDAPDKVERVVLQFEQGLPVALNGRRMKLSDLIAMLNRIGGRHGVGIVRMVEDRIVGVKNGGVYELPAAHIIILAHQALERYVCTRDLNVLKEEMDVKWAYLCYAGKWFDPSMEAINAFNSWVNRRVSGTVTLRLYKGTASTVALDSPWGLHYVSFGRGGVDYNVNASAGYIELSSLAMKLWNLRGREVEPRGQE